MVPPPTSTPALPLPVKSRMVEVPVLTVVVPLVFNTPAVRLPLVQVPSMLRLVTVRFALASFTSIMAFALHAPDALFSDAPPWPVRVTVLASVQIGGYGGTHVIGPQHDHRAARCYAVKRLIQRALSSEARRVAATGGGIVSHVDGGADAVDGQCPVGAAYLSGRTSLAEPERFRGCA